MQMLAIGGLSGSGKTSVIQTLSEDGFVILESLNADVLETTIKAIYENQTEADVAIVLNFSKKEMFDEQYKVIKIMGNMSGVDVREIYLKANTEVLVNRYRELRKQHPMNKINKTLSIEECINAEKKITQKFKESATLIIDTSNTTVKDLKTQITNFLNKKYEFTLNVQSFGFKHGAPKEADFIFDARFLPNPYYDIKLRPQTGLDTPVFDYVFSFDSANEYYKHLKALIDIAIEGFKKERRLSATIAFGCTGGRHRSVSFAERLAKELQTQADVEVVHIESQRGNW